MLQSGSVKSSEVLKFQFFRHIHNRTIWEGNWEKFRSSKVHFFQTEIYYCSHYTQKFWSSKVTFFKHRHNQTIWKGNREKFRSSEVLKSFFFRLKYINVGIILKSSEVLKLHFFKRRHNQTIRKGKREKFRSSKVHFFQTEIYFWRHYTQKFWSSKVKFFSNIIRQFEKEIGKSSEVLKFIF